MLACLASLAVATPGQARPTRTSHGKHVAVSKPAPVMPPYGRRDDVVRFAAEVAQKHDLPVEPLQAALAEARFVPSVARFIMPAAAGAAKNWAAYRDRFVEPRRIRAGVAFWNANAEWLKRAEERWGVPAEIVVGIVGVESIYGQQTGGFRVIDALATLSFDFPTGRSDRSAFFRGELETLLVMTARDGTDPLSLRGSYAGAIGMPQFMPSSIEAHAVDFDGDGRIDLQGDPADVIGSVAKYLADFGWQRGLETRFDVTLPADPAERALLLAPDILPTFTAQDFAAHGAGLGDAAMATPGKLALVELHNGDAEPTYVAGTANFYAVTRYNWSSYYAMAVIDLGAAVKAAR